MSEVNLDKLRGLRVQKRFTQEEIAEAIDISVNSYNRKENGKRKFTLIEAKKISDLFGVGIEELFFDNKITKMVNAETFPNKNCA